MSSQVRSELVSDHITGDLSSSTRAFLAPRPVLNDLTVVIPTIGRAILERCLYHIAIGSAWPAQLIVVDQSSSPTIAAWLASLRALGLVTEHVPSSHRGKAAALNRGIEGVKTRFVAITDDDCFVETNWLENMADCLHRNPEAIITGPAEPEGEEEVVAVVTVHAPVTSRRPGLKFDIFCGSNMGAAITAIERVGLFDDDPCLIAAEDCEWAYRVLRAGVNIIYTPEVGVRHFGWRDANQRASRHREYARSLGGFWGKYLRRGDWFIALRLVIALLRTLRRWLLGLLIGRHEHTYVTDLLSGIVAGWRKGRRT
jgi:cellulose synthase/poly-beta-1,6-N-acetylglucosamine synthase-like glycosyltransferase